MRARLGLTGSAVDIINLCVAFKVYHATKNNYMNISQQSIHSCDFRQLAAAVKSEAQAAYRVAAKLVPLQRGSDGS